TASFLATLASLGQEFAARDAAESNQTRADSVLEAGLEATGAGILVLDQRGAVVHYNRRLLDLWRMDVTLMGPAGDAGRRIEHLAEQTTDPARFIARFRRISADTEQSSRDVVELKDGRNIERASAPQRFD